MCVSVYLCVRVCVRAGGIGLWVFVSVCGRVMEEEGGSLRFRAAGRILLCEGFVAHSAKNCFGLIS